MTIFDKIKSLSKEEMVNYLSQYGDVDFAPWWNWFDEKYCQKCETIETSEDDYHFKVRYSYCELYGRCRFSSGEGDSNDPILGEDKKIIQKWLESEVNQ